MGTNAIESSSRFSLGALCPGFLGLRGPVFTLARRSGPFFFAAYPGSRS
jgi:hypothetical protein